MTAAATGCRDFASGFPYDAALDGVVAAPQEARACRFTSHRGATTRDAIKGMIVKPEDRADAVSRLLSKIGGRLLGYYLTFGEYDFMTIAEAPNDVQMAAALLAAGSGGGVTGLRTTVALTSVEAKGAFAAASDLAPSFKSAGGT